ncbi:hypothetical protein EDD15DRAFT_2288994 [Pisolithus albus]|nr:hypothetical protein EDD15DRAFT_2288994 [Pisolithus albus]
MSRSEGRVSMESRGEGDTSIWAQDGEQQYLGGARGAMNASKQSSRGSWNAKGASKGALGVMSVSRGARDARGVSMRSSKEGGGARTVCTRSREVDYTLTKPRGEGNTSKRRSRVREDEGERLRMSRGLDTCSKTTEHEGNDPPYHPNNPLSTNTTINLLSRHEASSKASHQPAERGHT